MSIESNKAAVRRFYDLTNAGNLASVNTLFDSRAVFHLPGSPSPIDIQTYIQQYEDFLQAFPDGKEMVDDLIAEGDYVVARTTFRGTNRGPSPMMGITSATNKQVVLPAVSINRLGPDGKIVERWDEYDTLNMMIQLGLIKTPQSAAR